MNQPTHEHYKETAGSDNVQAALAINHVLSDPSLSPAQAIELLSDLNLQIQQGVITLWEEVTPIPQVEQMLTLTRIDDLCFWRPSLEQTAICVNDAIPLVKTLLLAGGFFNNMLGEGSWLFDQARRPVSLGPELTRDLFLALRPILTIHQLDFDSSQIANFRTDDESYPGHPFLAGELSVWGLRNKVPSFIEEARLSGMLFDFPA